MKRHISLASCLIVAALAAFAPRQASSQVQTVDQLIARVAQLERRVGELEQRIRSLEAPRTAAQLESRPVQGNWQDIANWRRLQVGMTMDQVAALLGQPEKVEAGIALTYWNWGSYPRSANVFFESASKKLKGWSEPSR